MAVGCVLRTGKSSATGEEGAWDAAGGESRQLDSVARTGWA